MLYNFYYSAKQAALFNKINRRGGIYSYSSGRHQLQKNRINGKIYTVCCDADSHHGCGFDDMVLVDTADFSKATHSPDYW